MSIPFFSAAIEIQHRRWRRCSLGSMTTLRGLVSSTMSPVLFFLDFVVYPVLIVGCLILAFSVDGYNAMLVSASVLIFGYLFWTFAEYLVHRFVLHHVPMFAAVHQGHHDSPRDFIGTPTLISVTMFFGLAFWPVLELSNLQIASAWMAGLLSGYLSYISVHYAVHHVGSRRSGLLKQLKRQHALHHHRDGHRNFGVTTSIWDRVFRTMAD